MSAPQHVLDESYCAWDCEFSLRGLQRNPDFGFSTDEVVSPGKTLDSLTVSLQNSTGQKSAVLVTADASGVLWAPPSPGGLAIDPAVISRAPITFPSLQPTLGTRTAFQVHMPIPDSLMGQPVEIVFDLFDNQDLTASLGFFTDIVIVPEPSVCTFAVCGIWLVLWRRKLIMK